MKLKEQRGKEGKGEVREGGEKEKRREGEGGVSTSE